MKLELLKSVKVDTLLITDGNYTFKITTEDDIIKNVYSFYKDRKLHYYPNFDTNLTGLENNYNTTKMPIIGCKFVNAEVFILSIDKSKLYNRFEDIMYQNGKAISNAIKFDDIFNNIFLKINDSNTDRLLTELEAVSEISNLSLYKIPYYNASDNNNKTLNFSIKLNQADFEKIVSEVKPKYVSDELKKAVFKFLCEKYNIVV